MDFLPHTTEDIEDMLSVLGKSGLEELFEPVPQKLRLRRDLAVPEALDEVSLRAHMVELSGRSQGTERLVCFAGGGAYDHHVPAAVSALASRAEFATSYTPYQAELSQGVLQALFEFQTLVCELFAMEVANASLYDGANALVEAVNLAVRVTGRERVVVGSTVHPHYRDVLSTYTSGLGLDIDTVAFDPSRGLVDWGAVDAAGAAAMVVASPNFFGVLEDVSEAAAKAHPHGGLVIAVTDPTSMGVLAAPGHQGADVAVAEGHALGSALAYGGPYLGLFATSERLVRQVPGRIAGETTDRDGRRAFVLTLQAREQHIRRARAASNVCTNQTLMALAATVHLCWLGPSGLARLGEICVRRTAYAAQRLAEIPGCRVRFPGPRFKELVLQLPSQRPARRARKQSADEITSGLDRRGYLVGPALGRWYEALGDCLLVAVTERRTQADIDGLAEAIEKELAQAPAAGSAGAQER
ncbi:MAG: aminomethyl-transferring glycine dehydrogenase subunit GcvPA [Actinomycetota bacterium]|nr:aminomethyl-transferring glycine dehydrogenase subunit GcvPA [Actinomycetota bacterium]